MKRKYYARNTAGKDLFYIELLNEPLFDTLWLRFSFEPHFILTDEMNCLVRCIEERIVKEPLRIQFINRLINLINKIPGIEQLYFNESLLDESGKLQEENLMIQREMAASYEPEIFKPITAKDGFPFDYFAPYLYFASKRIDSNPITRCFFEALVEKHEHLSQEYAMLVDSTASFYVSWYVDNDERFGIYWMNLSEKPVLFFIGTDLRLRNVKILVENNGN